MRRTLTLLLLVVLVCSPLLACTENAATGRRSLRILTRDEEIRLGAEAAPQFTEEFGGAVPNPDLQTYVADIGSRLAAVTEADNPTLPWTFTLLNSDQVNAFALPGGKVFITRGLASRLSNEAQIAGVLGHEIGHVTAQHGNQRISNQIGFNAVLTAVAIGVGLSGDDDVQTAGAIGIPALAIGGNIVLLKYGRNEELEADHLGMRYMSRIGYDPRGQLEVMQVLAKLSSGGRGPEFLSTHPHPESRVARIQELLRGEFAPTQGSKDHQLYEERFKSRFLSKLARQEPAPVDRRFALGLPASWCATCAASSDQIPEPRPVAP